MHSETKSKKHLNDVQENNSPKGLWGKKKAGINSTQQPHRWGFSGFSNHKKTAFSFLSFIFFLRRMMKLITNAHMQQYVAAQTLLVSLQGGIILGTPGCLSSTPT